MDIPMSTDLTTVPASAVALGADLTAALDLAKAEKAPSTRKACKTDFRMFREWCDGRGVSALPAAPETVASYLAAHAATSKPSTLGRRVAAIRYSHKLASLEPPTDAEGVKATMRGIRRTFGTARTKKAPAIAAKMQSMVALAPDSLTGLRDRALLLVGFAGAFRRSELVALDVADIQFTDDGLVVTLRRSKTDQEGEGRKVGIPHGSKPQTCPVRALRAWLEAAGISEGPLFRSVNRHGKLGAAALSGRAVAIVVKHAAELAGLDAS